MMHLNIPPLVPKILSVDPGTTTTGWAISYFNTTSQAFTPVATGSIYPTREAKKKEYKDLVDKYSVQQIALDQLHVELTSVIDTYLPVYIVVEDCFINIRRPGAVRALTLCVNVLEEVARFKFCLPVTRIPPTEVKRYFAGKGNTDKQGMYNSLINHADIDLTGINLATLTEHEIDAIAIGYTFNCKMIQDR